MKDSKRREPGVYRSDLQLRVVSALVMIVTALAVTWLGGLAFALFAAAISGAIFHEWTAMARGNARGGHEGVAAVLLGVVLVVLAAGLPAWLVFSVCAVGLACCAVDGWRRGAGGSTTAGFAYAALSGISLALLRNEGSHGLMVVLFLFATVWATDIAAYFAGRALGGPKLAPSISPGKTWSGAIGGMIGAGVAGGGVAWMAGDVLLAPALVLALVLSVVSQFGDLFESRVKRRYGVKDSGRFIPGHGGVMDRVDGLVAAAFALYVIGALCAGMGGMFPA